MTSKLLAFFFTPALGPNTVVANLFSTHPTLQRRLDQLAKISTELSRPD
ncbi:hypothetical protein [Streptomyces sp. WAC00263]